VLGASISDLSEMLGVSRPTVYSYLSGNEPSGNSELLMKRVFLLQRTIETIRNLGLSIPCSTLLKRRDSRGKTFKELLANDELNDERIQTFCQVELQQRERTKQRISAVPDSSGHRKNFNNEAFSVPAHLK
jgi:predicted transcriptional regulator